VKRIDVHAHARAIARREIVCAEPRNKRGSATLPLIPPTLKEHHDWNDTLVRVDMCVGGPRVRRVRGNLGVI
jgi:hypothetical protein